MNIRQVDQIIQLLLQKFKNPPARWSESQLNNFCELTVLYWATPILLTCPLPKQRSQNYSITTTPQRKSLQNSKLPILDVCIRQYEDILEICNEYGIQKLISNTEDINMYFQIQKLKIWSFILLQFQHFRETLRKYYASSLFSSAKCRSCTAEVFCACEIIQKILTQIEIYIKSIYADKPQNGHISYIDQYNLDQIIIMKNTKRRDRSIYINQDIIDVMLNSLVHLPNQNISPLFWDLDDLKQFLMIIKFEDYFPFIFQNQIDGFVLLVLVNPPFKENSLFLKCLLINSEQRSNGQVFKERKSLQGNIMTAANRYNQVNQFVHLLHYLFQLLTLTVYKSSENYNEYNHNLSSRIAKRFNCLSLYYFLQPKLSNPIRLSSISQTKMAQSKKQSINLNLAEDRKQSKSFGDFDQVQMQKVINTITKQNSTDTRISHHDTETLEEQELKDIMNPQINSTPELVKYDSTDNWVEQKLTHQFTMISDDGNDVLTPIKGSIILQQDSDDKDVFIFQDTDIKQQQQQEFQESVILQQEILQQSHSLQQQQLQSSVSYQQSVILQQSQQLLKSEILQKSQQIEMERSILMDSIITSDEHALKRNSYIPSVRTQIIQRIQRLSLTVNYDPFQVIHQTHIKLKCDSISKIKTIGILGATLGRGEENTLSFLDHSKISSKHAKITFRDKYFYLSDIGSKGGTFIKIKSSFILEKGMSIYVGNKFAFKVLEIDTIKGILIVKYDFGGIGKNKQIYLKRGDKYSIGKDVEKNQFTFLHSQCNKLLSTKHMEIQYDFHYKLGEVKLMINDLDSRNGTWFRLSEKQCQSQKYLLSKGMIFNLSFDLMFEIWDQVNEI